MLKINLKLFEFTHKYLLATVPIFSNVVVKYKSHLKSLLIKLNVKKLK